MRTEVIKIGYIKDLSVNHYLGRRKGGGYYVKQEIQKWKEELGWLVKRLHIEDWTLPIIVKCDGVFKSERDAPDLSNCSKVILDTMENTCGVNDKFYRWIDGKREIIKGCEPYLLITIKESGLEEG